MTRFSSTHHTAMVEFHVFALLSGFSPFPVECLRSSRRGIMVYSAAGVEQGRSGQLTLVTWLYVDAESVISFSDHSTSINSHTHTYTYTYTYTHARRESSIAFFSTRNVYKELWIMLSAAHSFPKPKAYRVFTRGGAGSRGRSRHIE